MNNPFKTITNAILQKAPEIKNNPQAMGYLDVISSGDSQKGAEVADNLCKTYGMSREQMLQQAKQFFGIKF